MQAKQKRVQLEDLQRRELAGKRNVSSHSASRDVVSIERAVRVAATLDVHGLGILSTLCDGGEALLL